MIDKALLVEMGFDRVQGSSVWQEIKSDVYVAYIDGINKGESIVLDGRTESNDTLKSTVSGEISEKVAEKVVKADLSKEVIADIIQESEVEEPTKPVEKPTKPVEKPTKPVEKPTKPVEAPVVTETVVTQPVD